MSSNRDLPPEDRHLRKLDAALRREDRLEGVADADTVRELPPDADLTEPQSAPGRVIPNTHTADEELASQQEFEAGVDAADDEALEEGRKVGGDLMP